MLRSIFLVLSRSRFVRSFSERSTLGKRLSRRFIAGMSVEEALVACDRLNREGIAVTLDSLGESVTKPSQAETSAAVYHRILDEIASRKLRANVSLKLSQMGMEIDPELAERLVTELVEHAAAEDCFVRIDMEGSRYTEATISMTERVHARPGMKGRVGTVLQAYLRRSEMDTERLLGQGIRIRLCKGAYKEEPSIAFPAKSAVDANYIRLMKRMVSFSGVDGSGVFCGLATHDEAILETVRQYVVLAGISKRAFEFQMLYGVRRDLQRSLAKEGFGVRVYVPFGPEWYPYFMRRLAERPANVLFLVRNLFKN